MVFWKIYFCFLMVFVVPGYLWQGFSRSWEIVDFAIFVVAMMGLFAYSWQKKMLNQQFWKAYLILYLVWNVYYNYFVPLPQKVTEMLIEMDLGGFPQATVATTSLVFIIPLFIALYLYGFKRMKFSEA